MTARALFSGTTATTPADINARFAGLVAKGVYSGGLASATGSSNNVSVSPYIAMTSFGMLVSNDAVSTVGVSPAPVGTAQYVCIHAVYSSSAAATISLVKVTTIPADTSTDSYICVCAIKPYASGFVSNDLISYDPVSGSGRDQVTPVRDSKYLGYFTSQAARNAAFPNHISGTVSVPRIGDTTSYGTTSTNYVVGFWDGSIWQDLENTGALKAAYTAHVADYTPTSTSVRNLWTVLSEFGEEDKRTFLKFVSGSDRAPIEGLSGLNFVVSRNTDDDTRLPSAHTCFNHLLLPDYSSIDVLREKLRYAISNATEGFGLR